MRQLFDNLAHHSADIAPNRLQRSLLQVDLCLHKLSSKSFAADCLRLAWDEFDSDLFIAPLYACLNFSQVRRDTLCGSLEIHLCFCEQSIVYQLVHKVHNNQYIIE